MKNMEVNMRNSKTTNFIIACLLLFMGNLSCGVMNKQRLTSSSESGIRIESDGRLNEISSVQFSEWHKIWLRESEVFTAFLYSDSAIAYQPGFGFQLNSGSVFLAKSKQGERMYMDSIFENQVQSNEIASKYEFLQEDQYESKLIEKERHPPNVFSWFMVMLLTISVLYAFYRLR